MVFDFKFSINRANAIIRLSYVFLFGVSSIAGAGQIRSNAAPSDTLIQDLVHPKHSIENPITEYLKRTQFSKTCEIRTQQNIGHTSPVTCAHINEKLGAFVTANESGEIIVWDLATEKVLSKIASAGGIVAVELCDEGVVAALNARLDASDGFARLRLFEALSGKPIKVASVPLKPIEGASSGITVSENLFCEVAIQFDADGQRDFTRKIEVCRLTSHDGKPNQNPVTITLPTPEDPRERAVRCRFSKVPDLSIVVDTAIYDKPWNEDILMGHTYVLHFEKQNWEIQKNQSGKKCFSRAANVFRGYGVDPTIQMLGGFAAESPRHCVVLQDGGVSIISKDASSFATPQSLPKGQRPKRIYYSDPNQSVLVGEALFSFKNLKSQDASKIDGEGFFYSGEDKKIYFNRFSSGLGFLGFWNFDSVSGSISNILKNTKNKNGSDQLGHICFADQKLDLICDDEWRFFDFLGRKIGEIPKPELFASGVLSCTADGKFILAGSRDRNGELLVFQRDKLGLKQLYKKEFGSYFADYPVGPYKIETSPDAETAAIIVDDFHKAYGGLFLMDVRRGNIRPLVGGQGVERVFFLNSRVIAACLPTSLKLFDVESGRELGAWDSTEQPPPFEQAYGFAEDRWAFDQASARIFYLTLDGGVQAIDVSVPSVPQKLFRLFLIKPSHWAMVSPTGEYMGEKEAISQLHFVGGFGSVFPFEQFDARLNRPDILLEKLGMPLEVVRTAKEIRGKRLQRLGLSESMLKPDFHVPQVGYISNVPTVVESPNVTFQISAIDTMYPLERLKVYVNNVPVNGQGGESLRAENSRSLEKSVSIDLAQGRNKIQVSVVNSAGAESLFANSEVEVKRDGRSPKMYVVAMGVSKYRRSEFDLEYAAKDAMDFVSKIESRAKPLFGEVRQLVLTDGAVAKESMERVHRFLETASVDDVAVIFMAGHGMLDSKNDYYFGSSDIDPYNPSERGISFDDVEDILWKTRCFRKVLLMDTCHAGELDEDEKARLASGQASDMGLGKILKGGVSFRAIGGRALSPREASAVRGRGEWHEKISAMFLDLRRNSGATVLVSSGGAEVAYEGGEQKNGLFTHAVLEALDGISGVDQNADGKIQLNEITDYVRKQVTQISLNKQIPNARQINLEGNFELASLEKLPSDGAAVRQSGALPMAALSAVRPSIESLEDLQVRAAAAGPKLTKVYKQTKGLLKGVAAERLTRSQRAWIVLNEKAMDLVWKSRAVTSDSDRAVLELDTMMCESRTRNLELLLRALNGNAAPDIDEEDSRIWRARVEKGISGSMLSANDSAKLMAIARQLDLSSTVDALGLPPNKRQGWVSFVGGEAAKEVASILEFCVGR